MSEPLIQGPGAPQSVPPPPEHRVSRLVPFAHVESVQRSVEFYFHLGFSSKSVYQYRGQAVWAALQSGDAELMVAAGEVIDQDGQGILFYLYSNDLAALRQQLLAAGINAGEIEDGTPGPKHEMRVTDPDGYVLMVAQIEDDEG